MQTLYLPRKIPQCLKPLYPSGLPTQDNPLPTKSADQDNPLPTRSADQNNPLPTKSADQDNPLPTKSADQDNPLLTRSDQDNLQPNQQTKITLYQPALSPSNYILHSYHHSQHLLHFHLTPKKKSLIES